VSDLSTGSAAVGIAGDLTSHVDGIGVQDIIVIAVIADFVARGHLVGADARGGIGTGGYRGGKSVLLLVVVARGHVHADVAGRVGEGIAADAGGVGHAVVHRLVVHPTLVDEHFGIGHAEAEGRIGCRQRGGVVLGVVVASGDVEAQVAGG